MADAVLAPSPGDQAGILSVCGGQLLAVSQTFPGAWRVKPGPPAVVRIIAFMVAAREVDDAVR